MHLPELIRTCFFPSLEDKQEYKESCQIGSILMNDTHLYRVHASASVNERYRKAQATLDRENAEREKHLWPRVKHAYDNLEMKFICFCQRNWDQGLDELTLEKKKQILKEHGYDVIED